MIYEISGHSDDITDVSFTPLEGMVAVSSLDGTWSLHDYNKKTQLLFLRKQDILRDQDRITSFQFHPDGLIIAVGLASGRIMIYDVRDMVIA